MLLVSHDRDFLDRVVTSTIASEGDGRWQDYAGGYADMMTQRGEVAAVAKTGAKRREGPTALQPAPAKKMSFKQQHELKSLTAEIADLQSRIAAHQRRLADPGLFSRDKRAFEAASSTLAAETRALETAEERWLTLEMMREAEAG